MIEFENLLDNKNIVDDVQIQKDWRNIKCRTKQIGFTTKNGECSFIFWTVYKTILTEPQIWVLEKQIGANISIRLMLS